MFNALPEEQETCARDIIRWVEEGVLRPNVGRSFPLAAAVEAEKFLEANTIHGAGTLSGKVVITLD